MEDEILQEFLAESWENLSRVDREIVALEKSPGSADLLDSIFRSIHTIKGTCGFLGFTGLGTVAHATENVLSRMRDGAIEVSPESVSIVLEGVDRIKGLLEDVEATGAEPQIDHTKLIEHLDRFIEIDRAAGGEFVTGRTPSPDVPAPVLLLQPSADSPDGISIDREPGCKRTDSPATAATSERTTEPSQSAEAEETASRVRGGKPSVADLSIRVNVAVLDNLMNLVGELVLTRNQLMQMIRGEDETKYAAPISHLHRVTADLQEGVMKTRMQPIGNAWDKLPRLVRDLATRSGKQIELEMSGAQTELDRTVLEAVRDPLTHMVRNSADHGIERPAERRAAGKPECGRIRLSACHEGGYVVVCVDDDGAGINAGKVLKSAVAAGMLSAADGGSLSDHDVLEFVFRPGLSTANEISVISGRGVGMDVVKMQIERIGGTVDLSSTPGAGTSIRIRIPLTLAIVSALLAECGGEIFAIPQLDVVELVRIAAEDRHRLQRIHETDVIRLRDRLLPLVNLHAVLGLDEPDDTDDQDVNIVVVQARNMQLGLIASEILDTEEIVVKPVGRLLRNLPFYQGTTILGDGRVILILDIAGIMAGFGSDVPGAMASNGRGDSDADSSDDVTTLLLFDGGRRGTMAVPLALVGRLEEFSVSQIEPVGDKRLVQYRGDLMPLIPVDGVSAGDHPRDPQPAIVFSEGDRSMGLMVSTIQDVVEERLVFRMRSQRPGVLGTAIINGKATDVIDAHYYVTKANPEWFSKSAHNRRILVVDKSPFFRQLVTTALELEGMRVVAVESAVDAVGRLERGKTFDAIVADVELPAMDGWEFARWLRSRPEMGRIPLIALCSVSGPEHECRAREAGFDRCLTKFNSPRLAATIDEVCRRLENSIGATI